MANPKAPPGGFKQGGWYEGKQFWDGTFSQPGQINTLSNQPGAGAQVSKEVVAQTNPANVSYLESKGVNFKSAPTTKEGVTPYLNDFQDKMFNSLQTSPEVRTPTMDQLKTELAPTTEKPALLNRVSEFDKLRTQQGVADLEKSLTDLKAQEEELVAQRRVRTQTEEGKPVALNVISGRVSEVQRQENEKIDVVQRQKARVVDELNTKYSVINTYMNFMGLDYNDAVSAYDKEFTQNIQMYNIISGKEKDARSAFESDRDASRANLQIYTNLVTKGNLDISSLSSDQQLTMAKLEIQSGLPVGFMSSIKKDANADIIFTNTNKGVTQVGIRNADGTVSVQSYGTPTGGGGDDDLTNTQTRSYTSSALKILNEIDKNYQTVGGKLEEVVVVNVGDRRLSSVEANEALKRIVEEVGDASLAEKIFVSAFRQGGFKQWGK